MADKEKEERDSFLRSILNRGPNKRQIKPAENNSLLQLALGEDSEDSEEDEDFQLNDEDDDDEGGSGSDQEEDDDKTENRDKGKLKKREVEVSDDDDDDEDEDDDDDEEQDVQSEEAPSQTFTVGDLIEAMKTKKKIPVSQPSSVASSEVSASSKKVDILICGICLDDVSDEGDEIVECDNCGITVHEGCYGINDEDSDSGKSNDTDSPTELWFCDACKVGLLPDCELCPNLGGIFKETDTGQWVHLLCALYTPDVAFVKPEKLQCVTLSEVPPYKWGAKDCNLCEDERFCRTGVCIECDAGMCRTYFHVTCAQMYGLLSEVPEECDEDVADPLFAHCRLHAVKRTSDSKRRTWLAYQSRYKKAAERRSAEDKERVKHCLEAVRADFQAKRMKNIPKYYTPSEKIPRLLNTCPGACRQLFKKAQLLGYTTGQTQSIVNVRRKWFVQPALTSEFVHYYHDRSARLKEMQERQEELESNNKRLQQEEQDLREKYHELTETIQLLAEDILERRQETTRLHRCLCKLAGKELTQPSVLESKKMKTAASQTRMKPLKLHMCNTCKTTENQHQLVQCDTCHYHYHLACVDPPLTRMPKRSAKCLWQCSECDPSDDDDEMEVDTEDTTPISQGRQRRVIKEPTKFTPDKGESKKRKLKKSSKRKTPATEGGEGEGETTTSDSKKPKLEESSAPAAKRGRRPGRRSIEPPEKKKKPEDSRTECCVCKQCGTNSNLVRCDQCKLCYHFQCLDPPIKANPKTRGYLWFCTECDESEEESDEDVDVEEMSTADTKTEKYDKETKQKNSEKNEKKGDEGKDEGDKSIKKDKKKKEEVVEDQNKALEKDMQTNVNKVIKEKEKGKEEFEKADQSKKVDGGKKKVDSREAEDVERSSKEPKKQDETKVEGEKLKLGKDVKKADKNKGKGDGHAKKADVGREEVTRAGKQQQGDLKRGDKEEERQGKGNRADKKEEKACDMTKEEKEKQQDAKQAGNEEGKADSKKVDAKEEKDVEKVIEEKRENAARAQKTKENAKKADKEKGKEDVKKVEKEKEERENVKGADRDKEKPQDVTTKAEKEKERNAKKADIVKKEQGANTAKVENEKPEDAPKGARDKREIDVTKTDKEEKLKKDTKKTAGDKEKQQEDDDGDDENASLASLVRKGKKAKA